MSDSTEVAYGVSRDMDEKAFEQLDRLRRMATIDIGEQDLYRLLKLPPDVFIRYMFWDEYAGCLRVTVFSNRFDRVPEACAPPSLQRLVKLYEECEHGAVHIEVQIPEGREV